MTARTIPTLPTWTAGARILAANLAAMVSYQQFWANPPMFRMYQTVAQSVADSTFTQITCDTSDKDSDSGRGGSTPWSYTIPTGMTGEWVFTYKTAWSSNTTGSRTAELYVNGVVAIGTNVFVPALTGSLASFVVGLGRSVKVNAGDVIGLYGRQTSGGALNTVVSSTGDYSFFEGRLISLASP